MITLRLKPDQEGLALAAALLRDGKLVAFGTETVYGLGANGSQKEAVMRLYEAKRRPYFNPLISHFPSMEKAFLHVLPTQIATLLASTFWPGPLTLILPRHPHSNVTDLANAGRPSIAIRVPAGDRIRSLLTLTEQPIVAPSANLSGRISPTLVEHVLDELDGRIDAVIDSGPCKIGVESTIIDLTKDEPILLRAGGITVDDIEKVIGSITRMNVTNNEDPSSPGQMGSHYAPVLEVRLNAVHVNPDEALLAFGPSIPDGKLAYNLSHNRSLSEAATKLFSGMRYLDHMAPHLGLRRIAVMPIPAIGLGLAIIDRLTRAAAPRGA